MIERVTLTDIAQPKKRVTRSNQKEKVVIIGGT